MRKSKEKDKCYEHTKVFDFFDVMDYLGDKYSKDFHDVMFEMISFSDQEGKNDSLHRVYRHWLDGLYEENQDTYLKKLFDLICDEFEIPHDISKHDGTDETQIVFWVSW